MKLKTFAEWIRRRELNEAGTGTGDVAVFTRPVFTDLIRRPGLPHLNAAGDVENYGRKPRKRYLPPA